MNRVTKGSRFAVLGGCGFIGSHMVDLLHNEMGCDVTVIDNLVAGRRDFIPKEVRFIHHDITGSEDYLRSVFQHHKIQYVANLVAYPYVPDSFERPLRVFDVNAMGALKVMNAAQDAGVEAILQMSSAEIYGDGVRIPEDSYKSEHCYQLDEEDVARPHSTYGCAKLAIDSLVQCRWREAKTPCIALRQFNCLGERDELHPYIVVECVKQLAKQCDAMNPAWSYVADKKGIIHLGNNTFRDFLYAGDAVRMAIKLLEKGQFGEVYNSGSEEGIKIYDLARLIGKIMGFESVDVIQDPARCRPWDIDHLQSDNSKLYSVIDYRPQVKLEEALRRTINYFKSTGYRLP